MTLQAKHIQPVVMAAVMASLMTGFVTWLNLGLRSDFLWLWFKGFVIAWPVASVAAYIAAPISHRVTQSILRRVNGPR